MFVIIIGITIVFDIIVPHSEQEYCNIWWAIRLGRDTRLVL